MFVNIPIAVVGIIGAVTVVHDIPNEEKHSRIDVPGAILATLGLVVREVAPDDTRRAQLVAAHAELVCRILHLHHEGEDLLLWPLLLERGGLRTTAIVPTMQEQHDLIHRPTTR
jgi:hypothetical protein